MDAKMLLTVDEAADRIGLKRSFFYELLRGQKLPSVKIGGARRIAVADLERFVERLREQGEVVLDD